MTRLIDLEIARQQAGGKAARGSRQGGETPASATRTIQIRNGEQPRIVDEAEAALIDAGAPIFTRAGQLVRPVTDEAFTVDGRATIVARLRPMSLDSLIDLLGQVATFQRWSASRQQWVKIDPPRWVASILMARDGAWKLPPIVGVITSPTLRPDGSLLSEPGYDAATRLYLFNDPGFQLPPIAASPTRQDAERALALLTDLISGFPFVGPVDRAVALSGLLTTVLRPTLDVSPLHAIRAHSPGTGKSYIVDLFSAIATGRPCPAMTAGKTEEETEKRLASLLLQANPLISIDNVNGELGGDMLCQMTERPLVRVRVLGRSESPNRRPPIGSYGMWSDTVRSALMWLGVADPVASMEQARAEDPELSALRELFGHWQEHLAEACPYSTTQVIQIACERDELGSALLRPHFRELLMHRAAKGAEPSPNALGRWWRNLHGRVVDGFRMEVFHDAKNGNRYALFRVRAGDSEA